MVLSKTPPFPRNPSWGLQNFTPKYMRFFKCHRPPFLPLKSPPCLLAHMKLFTPSQALLGGGREGGSYPPALAFQMAGCWLLWDKAAAHSGGGDEAGGMAGRKQGKNTKHFCRSSEVRASEFANADFFHLVYNEIINQICGGCGIKCLGFLLFLS